MHIRLKSLQTQRALCTLKFFLVFMSTFLLAACVNSSTANMQNLHSGESFQVTFTEKGGQRGQFEAVAVDGRRVSGEFAVKSMSEMSVRNRMVVIEGNDDLEWATELGFSLQQPGKKIASATMKTDENSVDLIFAYDPWTKEGAGVGKGSNGATYRIVF